MLQSLAIWIGAVQGYRACLLAFVMGAASVLAFAPYHFLPIPLISLSVLVWQLDGIAATERWQIARRVLAISWAFGVGFFGIGIYWIGHAFLVESEQYARFLPLPVLFVVVVLPAFLGTACLLARLFFWRDGIARILSLVGMLTLADWTRGHIFTGFPWNLWGNALTASLPWAQLASLFGVYGLSLLVLLLAMVPAILADGRGQRHRASSIVLRTTPTILILAALGAWLWGEHRVKMARFPTHDDTGILVRLVQPNFEQREKQRRVRLDEMADTLLRLSFFPDKENGPPPRLIVWPEVALPVYLEEETVLRAHIAALMPDNSRLFAGSLRRERQNNEWRHYNSLLVFDSQGKRENVYDKQHLVPFGEHIPFADLLNSMGIAAISFPSGFTPGTRSRILSLGGIPDVGVLICYEAIFSGSILPAGERPHWLVNISNDAWFGNSIGPWQHLDQARLRSIEEGLPMLRATNTGISAVIDPHGHIRATLGLNQRGILDVRLPASLPPTWFSHWGDLPVLMASILFILSGWGKLTRRYNLFKPKIG